MNKNNEKSSKTDLSEFAEDMKVMMMMDGYDDCIAGVVERFGQEPIICYDKNKVLCRLEADGMDEEEALDFFYFNQIGAWMGDSTPCFLSPND
jgi:hypothetical protein